MTKLLLGILLLPASLSALLAAARTLSDVSLAARATLPFLLGFFGYPLLHAFVFRPMRLYVFGHELSHALAAWMSGAAVLEFVVGHRGGHVDLTHANAAVALAPYVVPVYAVAVVLAYRVLLWAAPFHGAAAARAQWVFLLAMGASISFHLVHTARTLWEARQPDLKRAGGTVFSLSLIALLNGVFLILALKCLFPGAVGTGRSLGLAWEITARFWRAVFARIPLGAPHVPSFF